MTHYSELEVRLKSISISGNDALKLQYVCSYLVAEVKDEIIFKGIARNAVQLESALSNCKCKANEMEKESVFIGKTFGIITDAKEWYFMECSSNDQDRIKIQTIKA
ncbi:13787_t:CDS:2, partial [Funneliformis geosporum]